MRRILIICSLVSCFEAGKGHRKQVTERESDREQSRVAPFTMTSLSTLLLVETPNCALHLTSSHLEPLIHVHLVRLVLLNKYESQNLLSTIVL
jgi:hypothetical protein